MFLSRSRQHGSKHLLSIPMEVNVDHTSLYVIVQKKDDQRSAKCHFHDSASDFGEHFLKNTLGKTFGERF